MHTAYSKGQIFGGLINLEDAQPPLFAYCFMYGKKYLEYVYFENFVNNEAPMQLFKNSMMALLTTIQK